MVALHARRRRDLRADLLCLEECAAYDRLFETTFVVANPWQAAPVLRVGGRRTAGLFTVCFFSSRRRHTRFDCDWSPDVCSSDLSRTAVTTVARKPAPAPAEAPAAPPASARRRRVLGYSLLAALSYIPPLLTAPGKVAADTKQYLYLDPTRLLERAPAMWDPNIGLGTVTHQNIGYLSPMGPYYWVMENVGFPSWVAQRIWLGSIVFFGGLGLLYLLRTIDMRGPGAVVAALAYMLSPYSLHYAAPLSVILLPWAAPGWLRALSVRALRKGRLRYPAPFP